MSFNNHDNEDPNGVKYVRPTKTQLQNIASLLEIPEKEEDFQSIQVYIMAKAKTYEQWKEWMQNRYDINPVS